MENKEKIVINPVGLVNLSRYQYINGYKKIKKYNLFNSCYINASIQCLFRFDEFIKKLMQCNQYKGDLVEATKNLISNMQKPINKNYNQCTVKEIKEAMAKKDEIYYDDNQEDANNFIANYLNNLIEETQDNTILNWNYKIEDEKYFNKFFQKFIKKKGNSFILDLFYGLLRTEKYCKNCEQIFSIKFNSFNILELPISQKDAFDDEKIDMHFILENFISSKKLEDDKCTKCNRSTRIKTSINSFPKCLIINFIYNDSKNPTNKISPALSFNFGDYIYDKDLNEGNNYIYHLKGIIFYSNYSSNCGHFKAACLGNDKKWYYFDDNRISCEKNLLSINGIDNPTFLFYEK